ncbi:hypothetical protein FACS1894167_13290 [Synergistales bacterium]|nr:hypothetical protein FACS1894167_13290 [Synergistales bacterium]
MDKQYKEELEKAKANLADLKERGEAAIGESWESFEKRVYTPEQIAESNIRVALISELIRARQEQGITQKRLEELSGVRQPVIARMETGSASPNINTVIRVLTPLGKTLYIGDLPSAKS